MLVFCGGMYRACSTWQYQIVTHLLEKYRQGRGLGFLAGEEFAKAEPGSGWLSLKTHDEHPIFAELLKQGRARAVYCYRDLRDVAFSLAHMFRTDVDDLVDKRRQMHIVLANDVFWTSQPHVIIQRYEQMVLDPVTAITQLAGHLGVSLGQGERHSLAAQFSMAENRRRITEYNETLQAQSVDPSQPERGFSWDPQSLLHWNHIRSGQVGGWRSEATLKQRLKLAVVCGTWLKEHGYVSDSRWIVESLPEEAVLQLPKEAQALRQDYAGDPSALTRLSEVLGDLLGNEESGRGSWLTKLFNWVAPPRRRAG